MDTLACRQTIWSVARTGIVAATPSAAAVERVHRPVADENGSETEDVLEGTIDHQLTHFEELTEDLEAVSGVI